MYVAEEGKGCVLKGERDEEMEEEWRVKSRVDWCEFIGECVKGNERMLGEGCGKK